jgi:hypothetical protein
MAPPLRQAVCRSALGVISAPRYRHPHVRFNVPGMNRIFRIYRVKRPPGSRVSSSPSIGCSAPDLSAARVRAASANAGNCATRSASTHPVQGNKYARPGHQRCAFSRYNDPTWTLRCAYRRSRPPIPTDGDQLFRSIATRAARALRARLAKIVMSVACGLVKDDERPSP